MSKTVEPRILAGFMELLPEKQIVMNELMDTIRSNFEAFGFTPLDTPVIELSEVLLAKAGGETEKQIYRFNKGDTDLSLRFDLTVPLARYVAQHQADLTFPFKRYQIGKVYRGEHPQKGRFREFYQCDIDVIGRDKLNIMHDAEIPSVIYNIFTQLGIEDFTISISNRKILKGFFEELGLEDKATDILRSVDKIAKTSRESVKADLLSFEVPEEKAEKILDFITIDGKNGEVVKKLEDMNIQNESFQSGLSELQDVLHGMKELGIPEENHKVDLSIARGLDYYTGTIYETTLNQHKEIGSICSGGRYENLASYYTDAKLPGVGISIGLTRLYDQFQNRGFLQETGKRTPAEVLVLSMDENMDLAFRYASKLRAAKIPVEVFMEKAKFGKKMTYANKVGTPLVAIIGENERLSNSITIKDMKKEEQQTLPFAEAISFAMKFHNELQQNRSKPINMKKVVVSQQNVRE